VGPRASQATPPDELARLIEHDGVTVQVRAAANPMTPPAALAGALNSPIEQVAAAAAANPSTPDSSLADVGPHATDRVQTSIVSTPKAWPGPLHAVATVARRLERAGRPCRRDAFTERDVLLAVAIHPEMAAAGLWTRPSDLAAFLIEVHHAYGGKHGALLGQPMVEDALSRQCPGMESVPGAAAGHVGLGFMVAPRTGDMRFGHSGANDGYRGEMVMDVRRGSGVVVMTNSDTGGVLATEIINAVAHVYGWPAHEHQEVALAPLDTAAFDAIAGAYAAVPGARVPVEQISFSRDGNALLARFGDQIVVEMYPAGGRSYLIFEAYIIRVEFGTSGDEVWVELSGPGGGGRFVRQPAAIADPPSP